MSPEPTDVPGFEGRWYYGTPREHGNGTVTVSLYEHGARRLELDRVPTEELDETAARVIRLAERDWRLDFVGLPAALSFLATAVENLRRADHLLREPAGDGPLVTPQAMLLGGLQQVLDEFANDLVFRYGLLGAPIEALHRDGGA